MTKSKVCHDDDERNGGKLHGNISRNGYGNAIIGRYGGCFEEAHRWNIQAKFYNEKFPLVYESDNIRDSLYEEHGTTLKHKCGKG